MTSRFFKPLLIGMSFLGVASAWAASYRVLPGETLSVVSHRVIAGRVWGAHGSLKQILTMNPQIKNPNLIYAGQSIIVPESGLAQAGSYFENSRIPAAEENSPPQPEPKTEIPPQTSSQASMIKNEFEEHSVITLAPLFSFSKISATQNSN